MRKPLTGHLTLRIHSVQDVDHAATSRFSRGPETFVVIKVEDAIKARTKASRNDRWTDETFNIDIDKANELELTVYDKSGDRPTPIGMLWMRISDIAEEMRRKKIETDLASNGWVSADKMSQGAPGRPNPNAPLSPTGAHGQPQQPGNAPGGAGTGNAVLIDSWFALEPVGRIHMQVSFGKSILCISNMLSCLTRISQTIEGSPTVRYWFESSRCCSPEERRSPRETRTQIRYSAILQYYALCALRRIPQVCRWYAV